MAENWKEDLIKNKLGGKKDWTDAERLELCHELDKNLKLPDDSIPDKIPIPKDERWTEGNWKEKMGDHPIFSPFLQENGDKEAEAPLSDLSEGLAQLKYAPEHNSPSEVAQNYKEEGVHYFKYKKYRLAIASCTEGIKAACPDTELNAQLHNNRAAAHFHLKNYRSALKDCKKALDLKADYSKAIQRAIQCATLLSSWDEVVRFCDRGLLLDASDQQLIKRRASAIKEKKIHDRDSRKKALEVKRKLEEDSKLLSEIAKRGVEVESQSDFPNGDVEEENPHQILLRDLEPSHIAAKDFRVHLNEEGELVWPVLFLYPEHKESDCILEFNENSKFLDHLEDMLGSSCPPPQWDSSREYTTENLCLFFEDRSRGKLVTVGTGDTLKSVLGARRYVVREGTPKFIILVRNSKFMKEFISQYSP